MATVADVEAIPLSGRHYVDALLANGPAWNYFSGAQKNTIFYSFAAADAADIDVSEYLEGQAHLFTPIQQQNARLAIDYVAGITGIHFVETSNVYAADLVLWRGDLLEDDSIGLCVVGYEYALNADATIAEYSAAAAIFLEDADFAADIDNVQPGSYGYQTLLHELGHMLGLKHPFDDDIVLTGAEDSKAYTLMSYNWTDEIYSSYREYDLAALKWIYGGDGLAGQYGINSATGGRYVAGTLSGDVLVGTAAADFLEGSGGNDKLNGGGGLDVARYSDARANHTVSRTADGYQVAAAGDTDELQQVERLVFADMHVALDIDGVAGTVFRMYQAALGRAPDAAGMGYWMGKMDNGLSIQNLAAGFMDAREFKEKFGGSDPSDELFITKIYNNVLHRAPDEGGFKFYMGVLGGGASRIGVLTDFSESPEYRKQVIELIGNGIEYQPYI